MKFSEVPKSIENAETVMRAALEKKLKELHILKALSEELTQEFLDSAPDVFVQPSNGEIWLSFKEKSWGLLEAWEFFNRNFSFNFGIKGHKEELSYLAEVHSEFRGEVFLEVKALVAGFVVQCSFLLKIPGYFLANTRYNAVTDKFYDKSIKWLKGAKGVLFWTSPESFPRATFYITSMEEFASNPDFKHFLY